MFGYCCYAKEYVEVAVEKTSPAPLRIANEGPCLDIEASAVLID